MQSKLVGAVGVLSAFVTFDVSRAATPVASDVSNFLKPQSFAELLDPVPDALALLKNVDEAQAAQRKANPQMAQYYGPTITTTTTTITIITATDGGLPPIMRAMFMRRVQRMATTMATATGGGGSAHDRRMQIIWCTQHPGRC